MSNKSDILIINFNSAVRAYQGALYSGATLTNGERETLCEEFQFWIQEFRNEKNPIEQSWKLSLKA